MPPVQPAGSMAAAFAEVARVLQAEETAQRTLQKIVDLAAQMIPGCEEAGVSLVRGQRIETPAASGELPGQVDRLQYESGEGPCLDAIRSRDVFVTDDLTREQRWPHFAAAAAAETGVHSMLSFRLFVEHDTLGALNLYSRSTTAFDADSHAVGAVLAAHAAVALASAAEHDKAERLQQELAASEHSIFTYQQQVEVALTLQRSMLAALPQFAGCQLAARYTPAVAAAEVGGDWYDAFALPGGGLALTVGDVAGHDVHAAVGMSQLRNQLRALAVDRRNRPRTCCAAWTASPPICASLTPLPVSTRCSTSPPTARRGCGSRTPGIPRRCWSPPRASPATSTPPTMSCSASTSTSTAPAPTSTCPQVPPCCSTPTDWWSTATAASTRA
jgi:putative methionine-R-sulfoxide reductase with GAF domain